MTAKLWQYEHPRKWAAVHRKAARAYQKRHKELGLCQKCSRPACNAELCSFHREQKNAARRKRAQQRICA